MRISLNYADLFVLNAISDTKHYDELYYFLQYLNLKEEIRYLSLVFMLLLPRSDFWQVFLLVSFSSVTFSEFSLRLSESDRDKIASVLGNL